jgi:hypothetical protein
MRVTCVLLKTYKLVLCAVRARCLLPWPLFVALFHHLPLATLWSVGSMTCYLANHTIREIVTAQVHEMELVRRKIYDLEQAQIQIKAK